MQLLRIIAFSLIISLCAFADEEIQGPRSSGPQIKNDIAYFESIEEALPFTFQNPWSYVSRALFPYYYQKTNEILDEYWDGICRNYEGCNSSSRPIVIFSHERTSGAFGIFIEGKLRQTNVIVLSHELAADEKALTFVLLHEITHYLEKHAETLSLEEEISMVYKQTYRDPVPYNYTEGSAKTDLIALIDIVNKLGPKPHLVHSEVSLPFAGTLGSILEEMILLIQDNAFQCGKLTSQYHAIKGRIENANYIYSHHQDVMAFTNGLHTCARKFQGHLLQKALEETKLNLTIEHLIPGDVETKDHQSREINRFMALYNNLYLQYQELSRRLSAPQLRFHSEEDVADINAINTLLYAGVNNISDYVNYLLTDLDPREQIRCRDDLSNNREPFYGSISNLHHHECWRIWRAQRLQEDFKAMQSSAASDADNN